MRGAPRGNFKLALGDFVAEPVPLFDNQSIGSLPSLLTIPEVARLLKVSAQGIRRLQHARTVPFIKVGGSVRFALNDVLAYLEKQRVRAIDK